jgi:hypothetical protein
MVNFCVHKNLLFYYCLLSPCIVTCKIYLISSIVILFIVIVSNICNEQNSTIVNVTKNILLFLNIYYDEFYPLYFVMFFLCQQQL